MVSEITSERRARNVAFAGWVLQALIGTILLVVASTSDSIAVFVTAKYVAAGSGIWFALLLIYYQRTRVARELLETEALREQREGIHSTGLFELEGEEFLAQQRRLRWMYRWVLGFFVLTTIVALGFLNLQTWVLLALDLDAVDWRPVQHAKLTMFVIGGVAFVAFLFSRYVGGMSREPHWRMLKAGAVYLFGNAMICLVLVVALALSDNVPYVERVVAKVVGVLVGLLALEFAVNFILDFYRPRLAGEALRPAFESRLLGLISEPGGIAKSIADAVNYQFGFEVSTTWFYKTLQENVVRLAAVSVVVLIGMTSIIMVDANEIGVLERWGRQHSQLGPGLYFKWPWPCEVVRKANVEQIRETIIGEASGTDDDHDEDGDVVITWTEEHTFVPAVDVLVATEDQSANDSGVPVSILRISMPVQYRVRRTEVADYLYNYSDPDKMLRDVAARELAREAVHFDYSRIMAEQRGAVASHLKSAIQSKVDELGLGLEVMYVGLQEIHPPTESGVAATFQQVATAEQQRETLIQAARIQYDRELIKVAGDVELAERINNQIERLGGASADADDDDLRTMFLGDGAFLAVQGHAGEVLSRARAESLKSVSAAASKAGTFELELVAYDASPELYKTRKLLHTLSSELDKVRKYVLLVDTEETRIIFEMNEEESAGIEILEQGQ